MLSPRAGSSALVLVLAGILLTGCKQIEAIKRLEVQDISFGAVKDGTYEGLQDNKIVTAKVRVTVKDGRVTDIQLLAHNHGPKHGADAIVGRVLDGQSLRVDAVSGATYSSKVVQKAIELALRQGL